MTMRSKATLLGIGTAGALGAYLYKKPRLRKRLWKTQSAAEAAAMIGTELQKDAEVMAIDVKDRVSHNRMTDLLGRTKRTLGRRFGSAKRAAKHEAKKVEEDVKHLKNVAKNEKDRLKESAKAEVKELSEDAQKAMAV